jgi:hypothetical protein
MSESDKKNSKKKVIEKAKSDKCNKLRWQVSEWNSNRFL